MKLNDKNFPGLIIAFIFAVVFVSCSNEEQTIIRNNTSTSANILCEYANIHNSGLDYIKSEVQKNHNKCTKKHLNEVLDEYVIGVYGKDSAQKIMQEIAPIEKRLFNGNIPSLAQTRGSVITNIANTAANECMDKIKNHLSDFEDDEIFDNKHLLEELHLIICKTYGAYVSKCSSDTEKQNLVQALGVLYGSIEYWTNSENVDYWSKIKMENDEDISSEYVYTRGTTENTKKDESSKKLSKADYITVIAAADTAGSFLGAAIASGPAAVAASAAAALYFDVE